MTVSIKPTLSLPPFQFLGAPHRACDPEIGCQEHEKLLPRSAKLEAKLHVNLVIKSLFEGGSLCLFTKAVPPRK